MATQHLPQDLMQLGGGLKELTLMMNYCTPLLLVNQLCIYMLLLQYLL